MKEYIIISKSRLTNLLQNINDIVEESSASKKHVGKVQEKITKIVNASFVRESDDEEFNNALEKLGRSK